MEKKGLAGDVIVSDATKAESLRKRLAEVRMCHCTKMHPVLSKSVRNLIKRFDFNVNLCLTGVQCLT